MSGPGLLNESARALLAWSAEQGSVRRDVLAWLAPHLNVVRESRREDKAHGSPLSASTVSDRVRKWERAGWVQSVKVEAGAPVWMVPTADGDGRWPKAKPPTPATFAHMHATNVVRLRTETRGRSIGSQEGLTMRWVSERVLSRYDDQWGMMGSWERRRDMPDAELRWWPEDGAPPEGEVQAWLDGELDGEVVERRTAVEVELTWKRRAQTEAKMRSHLQRYGEVLYLGPPNVESKLKSLARQIGTDRIRVLPLPTMVSPPGFASDRHLDPTAPKG